MTIVPQNVTGWREKTLNQSLLLLLYLIYVNTPPCLYLSDPGNASEKPYLFCLFNHTYWWIAGNLLFSILVTWKPAFGLQSRLVFQLQTKKNPTHKNIFKRIGTTFVNIQLSAEHTHTFAFGSGIVFGISYFNICFSFNRLSSICIKNKKEQKFALVKLTYIPAFYLW